MNDEAFDRAADAPRDPARRNFISTAGMFGTAVAFGTHGRADGGEQIERRSGEIPLRPLGRTGIRVSALGVGGHHLGDLPTLDDAAWLVYEAIDADTVCTGDELQAAKRLSRRTLIAVGRSVMAQGPHVGGER